MVRRSSPDIVGDARRSSEEPSVYSLVCYGRATDFAARVRSYARRAPMMGRRSGATLAVGLMGGALIVAFLMTPNAPSPGGAGAASAPPVLPTAQPTADLLAPLVDPVIVVDGRFDDQVPRTVQSPTRDKNQSKLFFADGSWWGVLHEPTSREARIQRLDWATQRWRDTGVVVDERPFARADVLYADDTLYVASAGSSDSPAHAVRVSVFSYERATRRWSLRPDFPVTINSSGVEASLVERADDGQLWVTYIQAGRLLVTHSTDDDRRWVAPYRPVVTGTDVANDQVGMAAVGGEVVLLWSNQNDEAIYATTHVDGRPDDDWAPPKTILQGLRLADNHVNIKALHDGRLFAVVKTSLDTVPSNQPGWDQVLLLVRQDQTWSSQQVGQIRDKHTRPVVVLDTEGKQALVFATAPTGGGTIVMKRASLDEPRFAIGRGPAVIATTPDAEINDVTTTKQPVNASTGLVVLASDDSTGRYVHLAASLGGPAPGVPVEAVLPDGPEPASDEPIVLVDERAGFQAVGETVQPLWRTAPTRSDGTVTYVQRDGDDMAVQLRTTGNGELRACRALAASRSGRLQVSMDVRLDRQGSGDTALLMARGDGEELGGFRVDDQLRLRISKAEERETTNMRVVPGRWYRLELDLDVASKSFTARLLDGGGRRLLVRTGQPWRAPEVSVVDGLCVAASRGAPELGLSFDDVRVTRIP